MAFKSLGIQVDYVKTTDSVLSADKEIREGSFYFTTDSKKMYADLGGKRHCFSSICFGDSYSKLLEFEKSEDVIYWDKSTNFAYKYVNGVLTKVVSGDSSDAVSIIVKDTVGYYRT